MKKVLVVEDNPTTQLATEELLKDRGYQVDHATDGMVALTRLAVYPADVVIADYLMPRMNGLEFVREVRKVEEWNHILIIFTTAISTPEIPVIKDELEKLQPMVFLHKPFDPEDLFNILTNYYK